MLDTIEKTGKVEDDMTLITLEGQPSGYGENDFHVLSTYEEVDRASLWIRERLDILLNDSKEYRDRDNILMASREALLNAVEHGNAKAADAIIDLSITVDDQGLRINISDNGMEFNIDEILAKENAADGLQINKRDCR